MIPQPLHPPHAQHRLLLALHSFGQSFMHAPALLGRTGFPVDAVITPRHPLRHVRGFSKTFIADDSEWADTVEKRLLTGEYSFFLNVDEPGLMALYRHSWNPGAVKYLPFDPKSEAASTVCSKIGFHNWCLRHDLPVPETHVCSSFQEVIAIRQQLKGDWFLKGDTGSGGLTVRRYAPGSPPPRDDEKCAAWLLQHDEGKEVGGVVFLADRGRLLSWFGIKQIVCLNKGLGPTVLGRGDADREIGELCRRVASASGVTGLTGVDFVRSRDRGLLLIDSHLGRMSPMQHFDRLYQVDFAASLRRHLQGVPFDVTAPLKGPAFIKFPEVLQLAMQGSLGKLLKETNFPVKMPLSPPGDPLAGIRSALAVTTSQARVTLGRWRRLIFSGR